MTPQPRSVFFETLGCKLNFAETSAISQKLSDAGFHLVKSVDLADFLVVNTCSVTDNADQKCRKLIRDFKKINDQIQVIIIGCYAQLKPQEILEIPGVDLVLGAQDKFRLGEFLLDLSKENWVNPTYPAIEEVKTFHPSYSIGERTRSFLKVQDGCDYSCTFCTIPLARGQSRNGKISEIKESVLNILKNGVREIVLTGVNIGDFGKTTGESFLELIRELDQMEGVDRFRISSIEPNLLVSEIIELVSKSKRIMPHFHIPLQSGSDKILGAMRRRYRSQIYRNKIEEIRDKIPHAGIGVDVIVGFPGEGEFEFQETYDFLEELDISYLHVFSYSERENTLAKSLSGKISPAVKSWRSKKLHELSERKNMQFIEKFIGTTLPVLFERSVKDKRIHGFTPNYLKIESEYNPEWINQIVPVEITYQNTALKSLSLA